MLKAPHTMLKAPHIMMKVQRIMMKAQHVKNIDHIRQSWLSIQGGYDKYVNISCLYVVVTSNISKVEIMAFRYGQNYIKYKKTIRSLFELIQVLTQIVNHPYLVSYHVITK